MPAAFKESIMLYEKYFSCFGGGLGVSPAAAMRAASFFLAATMWFSGCDDVARAVDARVDAK